MEIERILAPVLARLSDVGVKLFGSRARGDARRVSDIDIALTSSHATPATEMASLREALEESCVPFRIDLVDYAVAPRELQVAIDREGIPWHV